MMRLQIKETNGRVHLLGDVGPDTTGDRLLARLRQQLVVPPPIIIIISSMRWWWWGGWGQHQAGGRLQVPASCPATSPSSPSASRTAVPPPPPPPPNHHKRAADASRARIDLHTALHYCLPCLWPPKLRAKTCWYVPHLR